MNRRDLLKGTGTAAGIAMGWPRVAALSARGSSSGSLTERISSRALRNGFKNPPKTYRPMVRWYWPGGDVRDEELRREIRLLDEAKFGGAEIQPFRFGLDPKAPAETWRRINDYLTPAFFAHVRAALEEAAGRDMWLDCTFGSGWPFGGGDNITPELALLELRAEHQSLRGPGHFSGKVPWPRQPPGFAHLIAQLTETPDKLPSDWTQRLADRERLVAVVAVRGDDAVLEETGRRDILGQPVSVVKKAGMLDAGTAVDLTPRVGSDGRLEWDVPEGDWQLFGFVQFAADARVLAGVGDAPQLVLDHFKRAALESHIRAVGEAAKHHLAPFFGKTLRAVFCDSLELATNLYWTDSFLEDFRRLRGYDLTPFLPLLGPAGYDIDEIGGRVRHDYLQTVSDILIANFYQPFADWAERNGLMARVQAHGAPADVLRIYGLSQIPETESLFAGGRYDFLKYAGSASHVYGRPITASESFVWISQEYQTTPEKIKRYADELLTAGVNQIVYGGFPYEYMDRPEPGWYPFVAPFPYASHVNQHDPFWKFMPALNAYITRLQYVARAGRNVAPVAVFRSNLAYESPPVSSPAARLGGLLMDSGYNFDHINAHALLGSRVEHGGLVSPGGAPYDQLIFVDEDRMPIEVVAKLSSLAGAGVPMLFIGRLPDEESGYRDYVAKTARIRRLMQGMLGVQDPAAAEASGSAGRGRVRFVKSVDDSIAVVRGAVEPNLRFLGDGPPVSFFQRRVGSIDAFFLRNGTTEKRIVEAELPAAAMASPEVWDPWSGAITPIRDYQRGARGVRIRLELEPYASRLVILDPDRTRAPRQLPAERADRLPAPIVIGGPGKPWALRAFGKTREGSDDIHDLELPQLIDWSKHSELRHFSGKGRYTIEFEVDAKSLKRNLRVSLDLGDVKDVAEVRLNGEAGPTLLLRPYRAEITSLLRPGKNSLEVTVTNAPLNRLIGSGMELGIVFGSFGQRPELLPSGLLGPVHLVFSYQTETGPTQAPGQ